MASTRVNVAGAAEPETKRTMPLRRCTARVVSVVCLATVLVMVLSLRGSPSALWDSFSSVGAREDDGSPLHSDRLLDGLLTAAFSPRSCRSRYQFARHHSKSSHKPSPYLIQKLRKHEALQKRCGPNTSSYEKALEQLRSGRGINTTDCFYLVSISYRGLGNRMLATTSAFLYAVLTERVLLVGRDVDYLFCEPFPDTSWLLPSGFPLKHQRDYDFRSNESLGNMVQSKKITVDVGNASLITSRQPYVYLHLDGDYGFFDKLFYCDEHQQFLRIVPWLLMKTDSYLVPGLFLIPAYQDELNMLFPEKDAVFYHLGRYLFHPTNTVWSSVMEYYHLHLAEADETVGLQIRVFEGDGPFQHVVDQILSCVQKEKLLPLTGKSNLSQAVLITSLNSWYCEKIRDLYDGKVVGVFQPSHEQHQQWGNRWHDMRALTEIYLLSMTDVLVTSGFSTFGYVAQGLGGLKPWIMFKPEKQAVPDPPCRRAMSIEPCFHSPSYYDCKAKRDVDTGKMVPHVRHCEDVSWGLKLVNQSSGW